MTDDFDRSELVRLHRLTQEAERRAVRQSLPAYCRWVAEDEPPARHHDYILEKLSRVASGQCKRLIITAPPGSAKSTYASVRFPSWYLGCNPKHDIICASHTDNLAERFGRRVRNLLAQSAFTEAFDVGVSASNAAVGNWATTKGGEYHAVGVGKGVAGKRANGIVIDDPYPTKADAESETYRQRVWDWWKADIWPRLKPDGWVVLIQTRWHPDDLAGRLLEEGLEEWEQAILRFEAEDDDPLGRAPGELLWPEWFTPEMLRVAKAGVDYPSLYQQRPIVERGQYYRREWIKWYDERPERLTIYGASDYAVTEKGDWTVHLVAGVDENDDIYLLDLWRERTTSDKWVEALIALAAQWKPVDWAEEKGQIEKGVGPFLDKRMNETRTYFHREGYASSHDKPTRGQAMRARMAQGKVYFPRAAPWVHTLVNELIIFPKDNMPDDQADTFGLLGRLLDDMRRPVKPKVAQKPRWWQPKAGLVTIGEMIRYSDKHGGSDGPQRI